VAGGNFDYPVKVKFSNPGIVAKVNRPAPGSDAVHTLSVS
jgi:hypothetical protein